MSGIESPKIEGALELLDSLSLCGRRHASALSLCAGRVAPEQRLDLTGGGCGRIMEMEAGSCGLDESWSNAMPSHTPAGLGASTGIRTLCRYAAQPLRPGELNKLLVCCSSSSSFLFQSPNHAAENRMALFLKKKKNRMALQSVRESFTTFG